MSSSEVQANPESKPKPPAGSQHKGSRKSSSNATLLANILIIVAIGTVVYASQAYKEQIEATRAVLEKEAAAATPSQEPIRTVKDKKNVMCPQAKADL